MDKNLEMLKRAKMYMEMLAKGIDPISGENMPNDTILNNERLGRCFSFVSDVLSNLIDNDGVESLSVMNTETPPPVKIDLQPFVLPQEQRQKIWISEKPLDVSTFTRNINKVSNTNSMQKLKGASFAVWLMEKGFLEMDGKSKKPTPAGIAIGISVQTKQTSQLIYDQEAQRFLLDNIDEIIDVSKKNLK